MKCEKCRRPPIIMVTVPRIAKYMMIVSMHTKLMLRITTVLCERFDIIRKMVQCNAISTLSDAYYNRLI